MAIRILSGLLLLPLLAIIWFGGVPLYLMSLVLTIMAIYEFTNALRKKDIYSCSIIGYALSVVFFLKNLLKIDVKFILLTTVFLIIICFFVHLIKKQDIKLFFASIIGFLYIAFGFDAIISIINNFDYGYIYVWLVFLISILSDTMAYFTGRFFGKHKLAPILSPKKTLEGSIGAIAFSTIGCVTFGKVFNLNILLMVILGFAGSIISQVGDLVASYVKRKVEIKDYSNLIPGHGGILDRFDSIILVSQFIYVVIFLTNYV